jgi:anti-anti-sigma factor
MNATEITTDFGVQCRRDDAGVVVELRGELDVSTAPELRSHLASVLDDHGSSTIVIDLHDLTFIDAAGLGALVHARNHLRSRGGEIRITEPRPIVRKVLDVTGLRDAFPIHEVVESSSLAGPRTVKHRRAMRSAGLHGTPIAEPSVQ